MTVLLVAGLSIVILLFIVLRPIYSHIQTLSQRLEAIGELLDSVLSTPGTTFVEAVHRCLPPYLRRHLTIWLDVSADLDTLLTENERAVLQADGSTLPQIWILEYQTHVVLSCRYSVRNENKLDTFHLFETDPARPITIWRAPLGESLEFSSLLRPQLVLVFDPLENRITFGPVHGRFGLESAALIPTPRDEFILGAATLHQQTLRSNQTEASEELYPRSRSDWFFESRISEPTSSVTWHVVVRDFVKMQQAIAEGTA